MQLKPIHQQVVVVVGASSGIGRDAALAFAQRGAQVTVAARNQEALDSLVNEIQRSGGKAIAVLADVADFEQVQAIAAAAVAAFGRIDTWVHCAAAGMVATFETMTLEEFRRVIDVTLMGQIYGARAALPYLKQTGQGSLIAISSMEGRRALPLQSAYSTAKHGLEGFVESLRVELEHDGFDINVTSIKPAVINTPFYNHARTKIGVKPTGIPPYYSPGLVTEAILYAAEHPTRDYIVGDVGRVLDWAQRLAPALLDIVLARIGFQGQQTNEPKLPQDPDNLFEPMSGYEQAEGDFEHLSVPSVSDWVVKNPMPVAGAIALGAAVVLAANAFKKGKSS
ncbi:MAG: SDR family oxidoreductase [Leptolyngbyaceae cyanobacterium SM1_1_3]|nr:SDR family oxidoreductase [Leptolyngbyaceae cyanobacterium SM1_1_3]NJN01751.1 SDR family oxidoreductase [Leptolyngbyaceae cyanobacterium RM1_1_2]NJO09934.1 SDR family oxidoreductase [Leptolyngbyaceae cyanobacterium SL_1_1]